MTFQIQRAAQVEAEEAAAWYEDKRTGLGEEFLDELEAVYAKIEEHPHRPLRIHLKRHAQHEFHQAKLRRFPYKVIYEVMGMNVIVLAVSHMRRKPNYWVD